jgi:predicted Zn-dependent peptidase
MQVSQGKLCMGFTTPITLSCEEFVAMQVFNAVFGSGMTSKLFMNLREKQSLCYAIGSSYYGAKGMLTVSAGIDSAMDAPVREQILEQLDACRRGDITEEELQAAREALRSGLRSVSDSPGAMENYYATAAISGQKLSPEEYIRAVEQVTAEQVARAAQSLQLHTVYFLKGVSQ